MFAQVFPFPAPSRHAEIVIVAPMTTGIEGRQSPSPEALERLGQQIATGVVARLLNMME